MPMLGSRSVAVLAGAAVLVGASSFGAVAGGLITSRDIKDDTVRSVDVTDNTLRLADINDRAEAALAGKDGKDGVDGTDGVDGVDGAPGKDGKDGTQVTLTSEQGHGNVANIGGRFAERANRIDEFTLEPGTYQLSSDGFFASNAATSGQTRLQLALRTAPAEGEQWGRDLGTCFTGTASALAGREATCSTTRVATITEATVVTVYAFGYADDQGSADSGKFDAFSSVSILKLAAQ